ncbi:MAG: hypothetical protein JWP92_2487, partial [Caulobacter sp.]|nr:hypothetical protein [Caulobacter sp.]
MSVHGLKSRRPLGAALAAFGAALLLAPAVHAADKPLRVVLIDVEGGAATLFVTPQG